MKSNELQDKLADCLSELVESAKSIQNEIETNSEQLKQVIRRIYDVFHHNTLSKNDEENDLFIYNFLKDYLNEQNKFFVCQYVENYSQGKQIEKKIAGVLILCFHEKLLSGIFVNILGNRDFKSHYNETAALLNAKFIFWLIEQLQKLEEHKIILKSKWIDNYLSKKMVDSKTRPRVNFELMSPVAKAKASKLENLDIIKSLDKNDPIRAFISDQKQNLVSTLESNTKRKLRNELASTSDKNKGTKITVAVHSNLARETIDLHNINEMYNAVIKYTQPEISDVNSFEESKETFLNEEGLSSQFIFGKYVQPYLILAEKFTETVKIESKNFEREKCPSCGVELSTGLLGVY